MGDSRKPDDRPDLAESRRTVDVGPEQRATLEATHIVGDGPRGVTADASGQSVGRYRLLRCIGQGGMGTVYAAHDPELDRTVAVKLLRGEMSRDQAGLATRLQREAQALARLSHANVVAVHDVGASAQGVFIAMELIEGTTLRTWLGEPRPWRAIVQTFVSAGRGLEAAHRAGLVHRDFKPDNVLIGRDGRVCVTDFGLARVGGVVDAATGDPNSPLNVSLTRTGALVGTPAYMAPEQMRGGTVDERTDIFSFCVSLYEALAGVRPFAGQTQGELLEAIDARRWQRGRIGSVPRGTRRILERGLAPAPSDRPRTMAEVLLELARDPAVRARRLSIVAATLLLAMLGLFGWRRTHDPARQCRADDRSFAGIWDEARRGTVAHAFAATGAPYADSAARAVALALDSYAERWRAMSSDACEAARVRHEQSAELFDLRMECLGQRRNGFKALTDLFVRADKAMVEHAVTAIQSLEPLDMCAAVATLRATDPPPRDPSRRAHISELRQRLDDAKALNQIGRYTEALTVVRPLADEATETHYAPLIAEVLVLRGWLEYVQAKDTQATRATLIDAAAAAVAGHDDRTQAEALVTLVRAHIRNNEPQTLASGQAWARLAAAWLDRIGADDVLRVRLYDAEGELYTGQFRFDDALTAYNHAIALETKMGNDALLGRSLWGLGTALAVQGKQDEAERVLERSREALEKTVGPNHPTTGQTLYILGKLLVVSGKLDRAEPYLRRALKILESTLGPEHPRLAGLLNILGYLMIERDRPAEAVPFFERGLRLANDESEQVTDRIGIAIALDRQGKLDEAVQALGDVEAPRELSSRGLILSERGELRLHQKRFAVALADYQAALAAFDKEHHQYEEDISAALVGVGNAELGLHAADKALAPLERAQTLTKAVSPRALARAELALARALVESHGDRARAERLGRSAVARTAPLGAVAARESADASKWLQENFPTSPR
jgi:tetratricopeptide (TPR) repeat protein